MKCPQCGGDAVLSSPDYGNGAEYKCYNGRCLGRMGEFRFVDSSPEARAESDAARAASFAYAQSHFGQGENKS